jgi:hypothetical protein
MDQVNFGMYRETAGVVVSHGADDGPSPGEFPLATDSLLVGFIQLLRILAFEASC